MKLKEIKPGMAIHCKNDEEKKALLEEAERLGYRWRGGAKLPTDKTFASGMTIHFHNKNEWKDYKHIAWSNTTEGVTEFSDLILPELTVEEVLKIRNELDAAFVRDYLGIFCEMSLDKILRNATPEQIIDMCRKWKSDHEKKEPEIEWVYRVFGVENCGEKFFQTEEEAIKRCEELVKSQKTKQYARYERVCRVKEV